MKCIKCGAELAPNEQFCGECGQALQASAVASTPARQAALITCPNCSADVVHGTRFCSSCGFDLIAGAQKQQAPVIRPAAAAGQSVSAQPSSRSSRTALIIGLIALIGVFFLGSVGIGLWLFLGARGKTPSIGGTWNCEATELGERQSEGGITLVQQPPRRTFRMILVQNDSTIAVTLLNDQGRHDQFTGTFDGQKFSFTVSDEAQVQLVLSSDSSSMNGEAQGLKETRRHTIVCKR